MHRPSKNCEFGLTNVTQGIALKGKHSRRSPTASKAYSLRLCWQAESSQRFRCLLHILRIESFLIGLQSGNPLFIERERLLSAKEKKTNCVDLYHAAACLTILLVALRMTDQGKRVLGRIACARPSLLLHDRRSPKSASTTLPVPRARLDEICWRLPCDAWLRSLEVVDICRSLDDIL